MAIRRRLVPGESEVEESLLVGCKRCDSAFPVRLLSFALGSAAEGVDGEAGGFCPEAVESGGCGHFG
jgi:hypothetical protein